MYLDKNKIINALTIKDVIKLVVSLGSEEPREGKNGELIFQSVCHGSNSWKLYYYHESSGDYPPRLFHCYSGCGDSFSCIELIIRANRCRNNTITFYQALNYLAKVTGHNISVDVTDIETKANLIDDWSFINKFKPKNKKQPPKLTPINEHILEMFSYTPHEMFLNDHISAEVLSEFEISYWGATNQIVLPHRDKTQSLVGIRGRYIDEADIEAIGKYVPLQIEGKFLSHPLGSNLYGIHINQSKIKDCKKCLIVEAEKGVMQNHSYFGENDFSLATCGQNLTQTHIKLLLKHLEVDEVIIGYDKMFHENGTFEEEVYRNKIYKIIAPLVPYCKVSLLWDTEGLLEYKAAPTDYGKDVLLRLMDKKVEITIDDLEVLKK